MMRRVQQSMVLALLVTPLACKANISKNTTEPSTKATEAKDKAADIEQKQYNRRACWHEKRVSKLDDNKSRWRAVQRHAEKAAAWWKSMKGDDAKECEPIKKREKKTKRERLRSAKID